MKTILVLLSLLLLVGCQTTGPNYLNTNELKTNYTKLAVAGLLMPKGFGRFEAGLKTQIEPLLQTELQSRGFTLVESNLVYQIHSKLLKDADIYDTVTGEKDEFRAQEIWLEALKQAKSELGVDAFLFVGVGIVKAHFSNHISNMYVAAWDGQEEHALWNGHGVGSILGSFFVKENGHLPATSLYIEVRSADDKVLSYGAGGIELLSKFDEDEQAVNKQPEQLFTDEVVIKQAVQRAISRIDHYKGSR